MKPQVFAQAVAGAAKASNGTALARLYACELGNMNPANGARALWNALDDSDRVLMSQFPLPHQVIYERKLRSPPANPTPWLEMATAHAQVLIALMGATSYVHGRAETVTDVGYAYTKQLEVVNAFYRWMISSTGPNGWALELLYTVCSDLKRIAALADVEIHRTGGKVGKLEEASRMIQRCFAACLNDRSGDIEASRKMGVYYMATLLFKTYFKLSSTALCINITRGIKANELLPLDQYPLPQQVQYRYYMGYFAFLREDYATAEIELTFCLRSIKVHFYRQIELILDLLVPILLLRGVFPSMKILAKFPRLRELYTPFIAAFKTGHVQLYDEALVAGQKRLMERGTYLIVERGREGAVRGLMKRAWIMDGKPAKLEVERFRWYFKNGAGMDIDSEEVECLLANMIANNLIKGYISHGHQVVVLSKDRPFPWYGPFRPATPTNKALRDGAELAERHKPGLTRPL